jgi:hypothetical protein
MNKYTCPMHPKVISDTPGKCPKCGMSLVLQSEVKSEIYKTDGDRGLGPVTWKSYMPLVVIVLMILVPSHVPLWGTPHSYTDFIVNFMTGFFLVFAGFKLMDLKGFVEGYSTYDLLASRVRVYGYTYPFIELVFGLTMLAGYHPAWLLWTELVVMTFGGIGVAIKLAKREPFMCACLGTFLKVPLTYVTLVENFGMAILAAVLLILL